MKGEARRLCGRLSLGGLVGLPSRCKVLISNDSGPLHLAAAVNTSTVGIYWCVNMITAALLTRIQHRPIISSRLECPVCGSNQIFEPCRHRASYVARGAPQDVVWAAVDLLSAANGPS